MREAIFRETLILSRKFIYCCSVLSIMAETGRNTWASVAAYEASFYGAKSFCYLLGFASTGRDSKFYLDGFPEIERKIGKRKEIFFDTIRIHKLDDRLTHEVLWAMTSRLIDTTIFDDDLRPIQTELRAVDWGNLSRFRNKIYYDGAFWPLQTEMPKCDLIRPVIDEVLVAASSLELPVPSVSVGGEYFSVAALLRNLLFGMLTGISDIAPAVKTEVAAYAKAVA